MLEAEMDDRERRLWAPLTEIRLTRHRTLEREIVHRTLERDIVERIREEERIEVNSGTESEPRDPATRLKRRLVEGTVLTLTVIAFHRIVQTDLFHAMPALQSHSVVTSAVAAALLLAGAIWLRRDR